jgi:hypothetical protein
MRTLGLIIAAVVALGGCALRSHTVLNRDLKDLVGHNVNVLIRPLGYPERQEIVMGAKEYTWDKNDCVLQVRVDDSDIVTSYQYRGSHNECGPMAEAMESIDFDALPPPATK